VAADALGQVSGQVVAQALVSGLLAGFVFALIAAGLSLIFGVMEIVNFAHGEFLMISMYLSYFLHARFGWDPLAALPVPVSLVVLRPSRIFGSYLADGAGGRLFVAVSLQHYLPAAGTWMGSRYSSVSVQVATRRGWRRRRLVVIFR